MLPPCARLKAALNNGSAGVAPACTFKLSQLHPYLEYLVISLSYWNRLPLSYMPGGGGA